jgi:CPA1 family monovalent cation:H+ antiporter
VTLALALSVIENPAIPHEFERFVAVLATGLVLFTLFVNGPTLRPLLRLLGLDRLSPREAAMRDRVMALSDLTIREHARTVARDNGIDLRLAEKIPGPRDVRSQGEEESPDPIALSSEDRLETGLLTLANREGELYFKHLADRTISARFAQAGLAAASRLTDGVKTGGLDGYRAAAGVEMRPNRRLRLALWSHHSLGWEASRRRGGDAAEPTPAPGLMVASQPRLGGAAGPHAGRAFRNHHDPAGHLTRTSDLHQTLAATAPRRRNGGGAAWGLERAPRCP